ncbi:MAG TPA: Uma2 family endonuclease [Chloroflexota bacterium]|nr:Uma2 family endonuclease [Chloroflexota bacterium]
MSAVQLKRWSRADYDRLVREGFFAPDERVELVDGDIVEMTPQDPRHATAIVVGLEALQSAIGREYHVRVQLPLALGAASEPEPDLAVIHGPRRAFATNHPTGAALVVEVAESSLAYDRERKSAAYSQAEIPEYWIVNLVDQLLEVYRDPRPGIGYATRLLYGTADEIAIEAIPGARVAVREIFP